MKIDFKGKYFTDLDGNELSEKLSTELANRLACHISNEPEFFIKVAIQLKENEVIDITEDEKNILIGFIKYNKSLSNLAKVLLLQEFGECNILVECEDCDNNIVGKEIVG